jgi:uncharacterized repeat protein (TIGR03803 family)
MTVRQQSYQEIRGVSDPWKGCVAKGRWTWPSVRSFGASSSIVLLLFSPAARAQEEWVEVVHEFDRGPEGSGPMAAPVRGPDGSFYGTTAGGGATGLGTIYKLDSTGVLTTIHSFQGSDGARPSTSLTPDSDGSFYGTTEEGGAANRGTIFKLDSEGVLTAVHSFQGGNGARPGASLTRSEDGSFYGTTASGGACDNCGTVFKLDPNGVFTTIHSFQGSDGAQPVASLTPGEGGSFYGTTARGGASDDCGTIFKLDSSGELATIHSFRGIDGCVPRASLTPGSGGSFYGTTADGGASGLGTIFKLDPEGVLTTLHSFGYGEGLFPQQSLIPGEGGSFYGTSEHGGTDNSGTIFKIDSDGVLTMLHSFQGSPCADPYVRLGQAEDGSYFATTAHGGQGHGEILRLDPAAGGFRLRGDSNGDGGRDISDAVYLLGFLFLGSPQRLPCGSGRAGDGANLQLLDFNVDRKIDLSDPVSLLGFLFLGVSPPLSGLDCAAILGCPTACPR